MVAGEGAWELTETSILGPPGARQSAAFDGKLSNQPPRRALPLVGRPKTSERDRLSQMIVKREVLYEE
jgi:hypothetical protein